ncbi:hypothetical protein LY76DRAFT_653018 [Colletotrichum caudatum]|nr:hypothetical protein LY76DRAFT_653018 [Colletotrichum caudatum]
MALWDESSTRMAQVAPCTRKTLLEPLWLKWSRAGTSRAMPTGGRRRRGGGSMRPGEAAPKRPSHEPKVDRRGAPYRTVRGSVCTDPSTAEIGAPHGTRGQKDARIQALLSDEALRPVYGTGATQQRTLSLAAVADIDRLGLGSSDTGTGGGVVQSVDFVL